MSEGSSPGATGAIRLGIGFLQGLALWLLFEAAKSGSLLPEVRGALQLVALFAPLVLIGGWRALEPKTLFLWTVTTAVVLAGLGAWDSGRGMETFMEARQRWPSPPFIAAAAASLFIGHHLVEVGSRARRWIGPFADYFDTAWKHGVQLALSAGFVGSLWLLLILGGALFKVIGVDAVSEFIQRPWFAWPATATGLAAALHLTDVRATLVTGVRMVALALLSWLLPLATLIIAPFLGALLVLGLDKLLGEVSATALLLSATACLIILVNAAYQDGETPPARVLQWTARLACLLLAPLVVLAAYAVGARIAQHGLTPERVVAAALVIVGFCHAAGYFWAGAVLRGPWLKKLELTNIVSAIVALVLLLALFTPVADPARLSVWNQVSRLQSGDADAETFDYDFLRFDSGRFGREAIERLARSGAGPSRELVMKRAATISAKSDRFDLASVRESLPKKTPADVSVYPKGRTLPGGFFTGSSAARDSRTNCLEAHRCEAFLIDLDRDGREELLLRAGSYLPAVFAEQADSSWLQIGQIDQRCGLAWPTAAAPRAVAPDDKFQDIAIGDLRFHVVPNEDCRPAVAAAEQAR